MRIFSVCNDLGLTGQELASIHPKSRLETVWISGWTRVASEAGKVRPARARAPPTPPPHPPAAGSNNPAHLVTSPRWGRGGPDLPVQVGTLPQPPTPPPPPPSAEFRMFLAQLCNLVATVSNVSRRGKTVTFSDSGSGAMDTLCRRARAREERPRGARARARARGGV